MIECLLFYAKWAIFQLYHDENKLFFNEMLMMPAIEFVLDQHAELNFYSASSLKQKSAGRHMLAVFIKFMKIKCNLFF